MAQATAPHFDLARCLLAQEGSAGERPPGVLAAEKTCEKLREGLTKILGSAGFHALLARAVHLARADYPFLEGVQVARTGCLAGLAESMGGQPTERVYEAFVAIFGDFIWLLSSFIGDDLARRQTARIWPGVPPCGAGPAAKETVR